MSTTERTCSIEGCDGPHYCRGWCEMHYTRWRKHGEVGTAQPLVVRHKGTLEERFWAKVDHSGGPNACWPWTASLAQGYGSFGRSVGSRCAHVIAYELAVGPVPSGLELDHTCHSDDSACAGGDGCPHRRCCNPAHLEPVTHLVNARRGRAGARNAAKTHCQNGHPLSGSNLYVVPSSGSRQCLTCKQAGRPRPTGLAVGT